jgi:hypothetical protein
MHATRFGDAPLRCRSFSVIVSYCFFMSNPACKTRKLPLLLACRRGRCGVGEDVGPAGIFRLPIRLDVGASPLFPPLDQALIHALACEVIAETEEPLSRQSLADLVRRSQTTLGKKISRSTVWRMLHEAAIKPWQYEHWLFPKDPRFAEKAGPILDLYAGYWASQPLGPKDYVLSMDEKTSIQARGRCHEETPPQPEQSRRIEAEYERNGAFDTEQQNRASFERQGGATWAGGVSWDGSARTGGAARHAGQNVESGLARCRGLTQDSAVLSASRSSR